MQESVFEFKKKLNPPPPAVTTSLSRYVREHWYIDSYIAAYIQVQYRVIGVHPTGLTAARGVGRCPQGSPRVATLGQKNERTDERWQG
jgi:hypothetical protein